MANAATELFDRTRRFFLHDLWTGENQGDSWATAPLRGLQLCVLIVRGFIDDELLLRASALTYMSSLAIIPVVVLLLSVIDWMGMSRDLVVLAVDSAAAGSPEAVEQILAIAERADVGTLGSLGGAVFLLTTILSLRHVEETLNRVWGARSQRGWVQRFTNYLAVMIVVPLFMGAAVSLLPALKSAWLVEAALDWSLMASATRVLLRATPFLLLFAAFAVVYGLLPNTPVRISSALLGGFVAAVLFIVAQNLYVNFSVGVARYNALFGGFAALPLLLVWIYLSWAVVLLGAEVSYAHQNLASYRREAGEKALRVAERETLGLRLALEVARAFRDRWPPQTATALSERLQASLRAVADLLNQLEGAGIVSLASREEREGFQLGRPADDIRVGEVLEGLRGPRPGAGSDLGPSAGTDQAVEALVREYDQAVGPIGVRTLAALLADVPPVPPPTPS